MDNCGAPGVHSSVSIRKTLLAKRKGNSANDGTRLNKCVFKWVIEAGESV